MLALRPSSAYGWMNCPARPRLSVGRPDDTSDAAREGTCAAWVAERVINFGDPLEELANAVHPNGWPVDDDMIFFVRQYLDRIKPGGVAEFPVRLFHGLINGTSDHVNMVDRVLYVDDLKYGHKVVSVDTWQLMIYTIGLLPWKEWDRAELSIFQPRSAHPDGIYRTRHVTRSEVEAASGTVLEAAYRTLDPNAPAIPGDHCYMCPAAATCQALAESVYSQTDVIRHTEAFQLDPAALSIEMDFLDRAAKLLDARRTAIGAEIEARVMRGQYVPHYGMEPGLGNRQWKYDAEIAGLVLGVNVIKQSKMSVAEVEKTLPKGKKIPDALIYRPVSKPKLRRGSPDDAFRMFGKPIEKETQ